MPKMYEQYTDDEGNVQYREVEVTPEIFDDDAIRQTETYKKLLDEQVKTRQAKAELKKQLEALSKDDETPEPEPEPASPPPVEIDPEKIAELVLQRIKQEQSQTAQRQAELEALAKQYGLSDELKQVLAQVQEPESVAKILSKTAITFEEPKDPVKTFTEKLGDTKDLTPPEVLALLKR